VLRANIRREIETVTPDMLVKTFRNMERRVQACLDANGEHFHVIRTTLGPIASETACTRTLVSETHRKLCLTNCQVECSRSLARGI
jgi:hypothetical protein